MAGSQKAQLKKRLEFTIDQDDTITGLDLQTKPLNDLTFVVMLHFKHGLMLMSDGSWRIYR